METVTCIAFPKKDMSRSAGDPNFCQECGNVLPLPGISDTVRCPRCSFSIPVTDFSGLEVCSTVVFNPEQQSLVALKDDDGSELKGPVIDRRCGRCNKEGMIYHTRQMRSADEGQTVFFTCVNCRYQEKEDS
ncbi:DNA-directed RNA polymerase I subunit RPA12 [Gambusia affinis]|nr:DNA-directed RNA polymerase I subunit RPA12 [Gambusia affinis]XP_043995124.1 DNA-directed RNA polymerase I subunit RPA12 [Gambusia affinis]